MTKQQINRPSAAFIASAWTALLLGAVAYLVGLFNAEMLLNEKGYYLTLLLFGLFSAVSLQKSVRDRLENIPVSSLYYSLCWFALLCALLLLLVGLWNATLLLSEKGFYGMSFALSLFGAVAVQKNTRDVMAADAAYGTPPLPPQD
ncbi:MULTISPECIES: inner membrane protein YiaA [unclassified Stenotrophomonas]|uniref:inner membrane protein YiaA n=1 Tax=unclassified Stenotrophomonas TaxID=196198 RepID=UPI0025F106D8|nr:MULTISPECIES: inner membrane protein YiaA [unclassified Stenotrophomonas]